MNIGEPIQHKRWKTLIQTFLPVTVAVSFSFEESMLIVGNLIIASTHLDQEEAPIVDLMRDYAVNLMIILKEKYPKEWQNDWKNEAFLGISCAMVYREEEAFKYLKSAYKQISDPPQSLILAYIRSGDAPNYFLSRNEITELAQKALSKGITHEMALQMAYLAATKEDKVFWEQTAEEAKTNKIHICIITPNVLKNIFLQQEIFSNEP